MTDTPLHLLFEPEDHEFVHQSVVPLFGARTPILIPYGDDEAPVLPEGARVVTWLNDHLLKQLLPLCLTHHWQLALLPHPDMTHARLGFGVANRLEHAVADVLANESAVAVDLLYCNDEPVLNSVVIGDTYSLKPARVASDSLWTRLGRLAKLLPSLTHLTLSPFRLITQKDKVVDTAALGIVAVEHGRSSPLSRRLLDDSSASDGMLHTLVLAPRSVFELIRFLLTSAVLPARSSHKLPPFVGHIKSQRLSITSPKPVPYTLDGVNHEESQLLLRVEQKQLQLVPGRHITTENGNQGDTKEIFKTQALPTGEARNQLIAHPMPWIHHAATEEFRELFLLLRDNARTSEAYVMLMILSTLLATVGLFANSAPVIIGAMILAPLMAPIISMAMGLLRQDERLIFDSGKALATGIGLAIACAMLLAIITPLEHINSEIGARLRPTLLDLGVAVISGVAGAYAHARSEVARSLAGVAIAVALVPPLAVTGIGLGWFNWTVFSGALLLFLTNLAGIILAAALTFLWLGYSPFKRARRGLLVSLALVVLVSLPLGLGFHRMVQEHRIISTLTDWQTQGVRLRDIQVQLGDPLYIQATVVTEEPLAAGQLSAIKASLEARLKRPVRLEAITAVVR
ncbi:TIGR00341 family protein [Marinimicrobium alkaliphilum]|uniref:TIGR00341 family protein n=1 Tax=Marinimicrobium alkaliphilum TaxID=2202654 RepID=UPI0018E09F46|nr:TIGR00341 family protein [Marinimicrobium alkaliphilum]